MNLKKIVFISFALLFSSMFNIYSQEVPNRRILPKANDIFTIAFAVNGLHKESKDIYTKETLAQVLAKAQYIDRYSTQLKSPLEKYYWIQDGIVVLNDKTIFSFIVYEEMKSSSPQRYLLVYFCDGNGTFLYRLL